MSEISAGHRIHYRWVVCLTASLLMAVNAGVINSFSVFFKPLAADFGWSRATTSAVQSTLWICVAASSILAGWLADRFGPHRILAVCGVFAGLGLVLTSQVTALWQIFLTYSLMTGIGLCCNFAVGGIATARWFTNRRGLALGIAAAGVGLGNLIVVPYAASLIATYGWSKTYFFMGIAAFVIMSASALIIRRSPEKRPVAATSPKSEHAYAIPLAAAIRTKTLWILFGVFFLFSFNGQMINVHIVNYATDLGIPTLVAATLIGTIGLTGVAGRILMGSASDRIGNLNTLVWAALGLGSALLWLIFARDLWALYLFAVVFGFAHGAEVPQQTALMSKYFGLRVVLVGMAHSGANFGAATGSWIAGKIFDITQGYQLAFAIGIVAVLTALAGVLILGRLRAPSFSET